MKKYLLLGVILLIGLGYIFIPILISTRPMPVRGEKTVKLTSTAFTDNQPIPRIYSCDGRKIHPPLTISDVPADTKSFALVVEDPDASGQTFIHWIIWNIDPATTDIPEGVVPSRSQEGTNTAGTEGYFPPCPSSGTHRYFFTLYALDTKLELNGKATKKDFLQAINGHTISQIQLVGLYAR